MRGILLSVFAVAAACFFILAMPSADADGESSYVEINHLEYIIEDPDSASPRAVLIGMSGDYPNTDVNIPAYVTYNEKQCFVTKITADSIWLEGVTSVSLPSEDTLATIEPNSFTSPTIQLFSSFWNRFYGSYDGILYILNPDDSNPGDYGSRTRVSILRYPPAKGGDSFTIPGNMRIEEYSFEGAKNLVDITINAQLSQIPAFAFYECTNLATINSSDGYNHLPDSVMIISYFALYGCSSLQNMWMPDSLRIIEIDAFYGCSGMSKVHLNDEILLISDRAFGACTSLTDFEYCYSEFTNIQGYVVREGILYTDGKTRSIACYPAGRTAETYTLPNDISDINPGAFSGCKYLKKVIVNNRMTIIPQYAFDECTSLETVDLKDQINLIEECAFVHCINLRTVTGFSAVTSIGWWAFDHTALTEVKFSDSIRLIDEEAFGATNLTSLTIPDCEVRICYGAFLGCLGLKDITFEGDRMILESGSLNIGTDEENVAHVTVHLINTASIPSNACEDDFTVLDIDKEGEYSYAYENLIGVAVCLILLIGILAIIREV